MIGMEEIRLRLEAAAGQHHQPNAALQLYQALLAEVPEHPVALNNLAVLLRLNGYSAEAAGLLQRALASAPGLVGNCQQIHHNLAVCADDLGQPQQMHAAFAQALDCDGSAADTAHWLGLVGQPVTASGTAAAPQASWPWTPIDGAAKISRHLAALRPGAPLRVVVGGHWSNNPDWLILTQFDQDLSRRMLFRDDSVDGLFCEHVLEHLTVAVALGFLSEALRILRPGGRLRVVCPMIEGLTRPCDPDRHGARLVESAAQVMPDVVGSLRNRGVALERHSQIINMNNIFYNHGHKFIWSAGLLIDVLNAIGFTEARECEVGQGSDAELCIERRARGIYLGNDYRDDRALGVVFDPESGVVEARKPA